VAPDSHKLLKFREGKIKEIETMRCAIGVVAFLVAVVIELGSAVAARPGEPRQKADFVVTGTVMAVYQNESEGYHNYIIEVRVEEVEKGKDIKPYDTFRAFCYQRKPGKGGLQFDTAGHKTVPKEGDRVKMYVMRARGKYEGTYPDWVDVLPPKEKNKSS
jgi:hypothetical protein